jgi:AcrR family transcriptional regulator
MESMDITTMDKVKDVNRGAARKARTREKLLSAGRQLLTGGLDNVTIKHITEQADVGLGSFYNHFKSKPDVLIAIADDYLITYNEELNRLIAGIEDQAEIACVSYRYTVLQARDKQIFSIFQQLPRRYLLDRIVQRAIAEVEVGIEAGRFDIENPKLTLLFASSALLGVMDYLAHGKLTKEEAEQTAVYHLRLHGVSEKEAKALVAKPLPKLKH